MIRSIFIFTRLLFHGYPSNVGYTFATSQPFVITYHFKISSYETVFDIQEKWLPGCSLLRLSLFKTRHYKILWNKLTKYLSGSETGKFYAFLWHERKVQGKLFSDIAETSTANCVSRASGAPTACERRKFW